MYPDLRESVAIVATARTEAETADMAVDMAETADKAAETVVATTAADHKAVETEVGITGADPDNKAAEADLRMHRVRSNLHRKEAVTNDITEKS